MANVCSTVLSIRPLAIRAERTLKYLFAAFAVNPFDVLGGWNSLGDWIIPLELWRSSGTGFFFSLEGLGNRS